MTWNVSHSYANQQESSSHPKLSINVMPAHQSMSKHKALHPDSVVSEVWTISPEQYSPHTSGSCRIMKKSPLVVVVVVTDELEVVDPSVVVVVLELVDVGDVVDDAVVPFSKVVVVLVPSTFM